MRHYLRILVTGMTRGMTRRRPFAPLSSTRGASSSHQTQQNSILRDPKNYRGLTYTKREREQLGLLGILPPAVRTPQMEELAVLKNLDRFDTPLSKYIYLRGVMDINQRLFFKLLIDYTEKLMPIVYTPTVGEACIHYSTLFRRPMGLFLTLDYKGKISEILSNWPEKDVRAIVVTDGERILGLGDLGANGMGISIGKLALYSALSRVAPHYTLPITIDVGTNNETLLDDPLYIGTRQKRVTGPVYDDFIDEFMEAVVERYGKNCLVQFEDFSGHNAFRFKKKYNNKYCTFNDDIQGTASVVLSGLYTSTGITKKPLHENIFLFAGAGEAATGCADLLATALQEEGLDEDEACDRIWMTDVNGLLTTSRDDVKEFVKPFAKNHPGFASNKLSDMVREIRPTVLIGATGRGGLFSEDVLRAMAEINERPIVFALSNPTSCSECTAEEAYHYTEGRVIFTSGSPFDPVEYNGRVYHVGQGNNAYIFPAVALAVLACGIEHIDNKIFLETAKALSRQLRPEHLAEGRIYPPLSNIHEVSVHVAAHLVDYFYDIEIATVYSRPYDSLAFLRKFQYSAVSTTF